MGRFGFFLKRTLFLTSLFIIISLVFADSANAAPTFPLQLMGTGKTQYLAGQNGEPFFMNGDAGWSLIVQPNQNDAIYYLDTRLAQGYNLILINLIDHKFADNAPANYNNDPPFTGQPFTSPNEAYFAHADWVLDQANQRGMAVLLDPLYLGYNCGNEGWCGELRNSSIADLETWANYLGNRYKNQSNIIWMVGGDTNPNTADKIKVRAFAQALEAADPNHLITAHNAPLNAAMDVWPNESWLDLNNVYYYGTNGQRNGITYGETADQFNLNNFKPLFLLETVYDNEHNTYPKMQRSSAYWAVLSGANLGHVFGSCPVWHYNHGPSESFCDDTQVSWQAQMVKEAGESVPKIGPLMYSRDFYNLVPDLNNNILVGGIGTGTSKAVASQTNDGRTMIAYTPVRKDLTIDLSQMSGNNSKAWWFNPLDGTATLINDSIPNSGDYVFSSSGLGNHDWVLVVDNAALNLGAPGGVEITPPSPTPIPSNTPTPDPTIPPVSNLLAAYSFDTGSGSILFDLTGNGYDGDILGQPAWTTGKYGSALSFDGIDDYVNLGPIADLSGQSEITLSAWIKRAAPNSAIEIGKQSGAGGGYGMGLEAKSDGTLHYLLTNTFAVQSYGYITNNDTNWHHVAMVFDGSQTGNENRLMGYLDGQPQTLNFEATIPSVTHNDAVDFNIGMLSGIYSQGLIDEVRIYNKALSQAEVLSDMQTPVSGNTSVPGDANEDGLVNIQDYVILSNTFGSTSDLRADFDDNGTINIQDYIILSNNFGG